MSSGYDGVLSAAARIVLGLVVFAGSALTLELEPGPSARARVARDPAPGMAVVAGSEHATLAPPGSAAAVRAARAEQLATQIWIETRAGHCSTAIDHRAPARGDRSRR
ncbi:MAG: hypothetical protein ABIY55_29555, partial [Kofleriaceae bacterium]